MKDLFSIVADINGYYELVLVHTSESAFDCNSVLKPKFAELLSVALHHSDWQVSLHFERKYRSLVKKSPSYKFHLFI